MSINSSRKGFCPQLPLLFEPLPYPPEEAWIHLDEITAQFLLQHFTDSSEDASRCAVLGQYTTV